MTEKVYSGKEGEKAAIELQRQLKQQASETVRSGGFQPSSSADDQSKVSIGR
ncbi:MAG: hypothetical protein ACD_5C00092G0001 [uncultured bacterium]|nr:MAG: hypothetical protein ACD_5C00092G0001 [uncultured bacterium]